MGPTGSGKSTFINAIVNKEVALVGHGLSTCTQQIKAHKYVLSQNSEVYPGKTVVLVDTPGFDDTAMHDSTRVFKDVVQWAAEYPKKQETSAGGKNSPGRITGFIYLQDISQKRINNRQNIDFSRLQQLLGEPGSESYSKLFLATFQWPPKPSELTSPSSVVDTTTAAATRGSASQSLIYQQAEDREKELKKKFWKDLVDKGARMVRVEDSVHDPHAVLLEVLRTLGQISSPLNPP
ncbi:hypothetical protein EST38_g6469 [Candolleomyces aberdarensis]|uniref:G domain-containing protein n=1 Tax=Candolleomyces aberdarensis TaxID=2316362 RepID=A0A4Q2DHJ7_9AGAR|nr:hypothetical protein EST38_g6469 [Candolleomyces aberdarensis]